ncbi:hypothetical protein ACFLTP_06290, partial [Chloroflexota bacterium]
RASCSPLLSNIVAVGQTRTDIITIENKEVNPVTVTLKGSSSETGEFLNRTVVLTPATILDKSGLHEARTFVESRSVCDTTSTRTITYELYHQLL